MGRGSADGRRGHPVARMPRRADHAAIPVRQEQPIGSPAFRERAAHAGLPQGSNTKRSSRLAIGRIVKKRRTGTLRGADATGRVSSPRGAHHPGLTLEPFKTSVATSCTRTSSARLHRSCTFILLYPSSL